MGRYKVWWMSGGLVMAAWGAYALISKHTRVPDTAEAVVTLVPQKASFEKMKPEDRKAAITRVSEAVSQLPFPEREALGRKPQTQDFMKDLTEEEKVWYVKKVMPKRMKEALERFSKRPPEERAKIVDRAIEEMRHRRGDGDGKPLSQDEERQARDQLSRPEASEAYKSIMRFYMTEMTPEQKGELAPLIREVANQFQEASDRAGK